MGLTVNVIGAAVTIPIWLFQVENLPVLATGLAGAGSARIVMGVRRGLAPRLA